jgi:hypothetical protein
MPYSTLARAILGAVFVLLLQLAPAAAQFHTYVSASGSDANNCIATTTACRTLQVAHDAAFAGGKVIVLDSGQFNRVIITKSIAIAATGAHGSLFSTTLTKITINAGPDDVIDIDGLALGGSAPTGTNSGIQFNSGARLHVRNCAIRNNGTAGIYVRGGGTKRVFISDCTIANNFHGVFVKPAGAGGSRVLLDRVRIEGNSGHGIRAVGSKAIVRVSNSTIANNNRGFSTANGGKIVSFGNNVLIDNTANGAPTSTIALK